MLWLIGYLGWQLYARRRNNALAHTAYYPSAGCRWFGGGGAFSGLFTVGGGTASSPMLVGLFGYRQAAARRAGAVHDCASSLVAMATLNSRRQVVNWQLGIPMAIGGLSTIRAGRAGAAPADRAARHFLVFLMVTVALMFPKLSVTTPTRVWPAMRGKMRLQKSIKPAQLGIGAWARCG